MELRAELLPPPVERARPDETGAEIRRIADLLLDGDAGAAEAVAAFNTRTGHAYGPLDFTEYEGSRSLAEFALEAARPARPRVTGVTVAELVEIVRRILEGDPEADHYLRLFQAGVTHPRAAGLIFHPPAHLLDASAERIVEEALRYRPIAL